VKINLNSALYPSFYIPSNMADISQNKENNPAAISLSSR